jgi:hypothetical protein
MLKGRATKESTSLWAEKKPGIIFNALAKNGPLASQAGFGCYRVTHRTGEHGEALIKAIKNGINLIDTSSNYMDGESEVLIGRVLQEMVEKKEINRQDVVVVSKAGYLQGSNLEQAKALGGFLETVPYAEHLKHCIHPDFLAHQITQSLGRMGLESLDVFLLHNPEYFLDWATRQQKLSLGEARAEYYRRLKNAFVYLEKERKQGRIGFFGVSSNTFVADFEHPEFTSLDMVWQAAQEAGASGFKVVQFPLNLLEPEAVLNLNQPGQVNVLDYAREKGLAVLVNRPLNAMAGGRLIRLAMNHVEPGPLRMQVIESIMDLMDSEDHLKMSLIPNLDLDAETEALLLSNFSVGKTLISTWQQMSGLEHFLAVESGYLAPRVNQALGLLARRLGDSKEGIMVLERHVKILQSAFDQVAQWHKARDREISAKVWQNAAATQPDWAKAGSLSHMALRAVRCTKGVTSVLVGMRKQKYVDDVLAELAQKCGPLTDARTWSDLVDLANNSLTMDQS